MDIEPWWGDVIMSSSLEEAIKLFKKPGNAYRRDTSGQTPLHIYARIGRLELVKYLINTFYVGVNIPDKNRWTPLHYATKNGHSEVAHFLVKNGARRDIVD